jgi:uncharacterized membrane protein YbhN (UPF0104 family)
MEQRKKNKSKHLPALVVKITIALLATWFIYKQVFEKENIWSLFDDYQNIFRDSSKSFLLPVIFLLMLANWSVEAIKWRMMIGKIQQVSFSKSLKAVFSGLTISFFTPNRIGEYAGRVFHLDAPGRIQATLVTVVENLSQLLVTMIAGSISLLFYLHLFTSISGAFLISIAVLVVAFIAGSSLLFLNVSLLKSFLNKWRWTKPWLKYTEVFGYYSYRELLPVVMLAALRYLIFTTQFYLLLRVFNIELPYFLSCMLISMTYFVMSLIPTIALTEIGVRGAVATFFLGRITNDSLGILNSTLSLWLINLVIPALAGTIFVFMFKLERVKTG